MNRIFRIMMAEIASIFGLGCSEQSDMKGAEAEMVAFAKKISVRDIAGAYRHLSVSYQKSLPFVTFEKHALWFLSSEFGPIQRVYIQDSNSMNGWRIKESGDVAWVYVIVEGAEFADAIAGIVLREDDRLQIRHLDWGKP